MKFKTLFYIYKNMITKLKRFENLKNVQIQFSFTIFFCVVSQICILTIYIFPHFPHFIISSFSHLPKGFFWLFCRYLWRCSLYNFVGKLFFTHFLYCFCYIMKTQPKSKEMKKKKKFFLRFHFVFDFGVKIVVGNSNICL